MNDNNSLQLVPFERDDYDQLISSIPDDRFLLQWAGPEYTYPLDARQLDKTLSFTTGKQPSFIVFKAIRFGKSDTVGHIQLMRIDYTLQNCTIGRILIFENYRGLGLGKEITKCAAKYAFNELSLNEILLSVFDFNMVAISTYKSIGFEEYQYNKGACPFNSEKWNVIKMKISKKRWHQINK
jgi:RimJ/RimL family protein N-acetyltransferase